jgi:acyl-CoA dehydrogenase
MTLDTASRLAAAQRVATVLPALRDQAALIDEEASFPEAGLAALRESGLMGLMVPAEYGGLGGDAGDLARTADLLAGACLSTAMIWAMHCQQVAAVVAYAPEPLRGSLLPRIAAGQVYIASVTSEKGKGGHLLTAAAPLRRVAGTILIGRDAPIVTGGTAADGFLITMRDDPEAGPDEVSLVYADRTDLTARTRGDWNPMGMRGTQSLGMELTGSVGEGNVIGRPGGFRDVAVKVFAPVGHIAWAACWLGAARAAFASVLSLLRDRSTRGQFDLHSDLLRHRLARVRMDLDTVAALLAQVIHDVRDAPDIEAGPVQLRLNALKVLAAERSFAVVDRLLEIVGLRHGYLRGGPLPLERLFRDLRSASLNYADDRLLQANGTLALFDREVSLEY